MRFFAILALMAMSTGGALASDAAAFAKACVSAGGAAELCACKGEAAGKLLDDRMLGLVMLSMTSPEKFTAQAQNGGLSDADSRAWNGYIQESNRVCKPGY